MKLEIYSFKTIILLFVVSFVLIASVQVGVGPYAVAQNKTSECVQYESKQKLIHINCKSIHLSDINEHLNNASILRSESNASTNKDVPDGKVWILNAGIVIEKQGRLIIDSTDTSWLKLVPTPTIQPAKQLVPLVEENGTETYDEEQVEDAIVSKLISTQNMSNNTNNDVTNVTNVTNANEQQPILVSKNNKNNPNGIHVRGSLTIDSVKIT